MSARSDALLEAASEAESTIALFPQDTDWGSAIAGAMEGLADRLRRMAGKDEAEEQSSRPAAEATPEGPRRRHQLLTLMRDQGGRWKSGTVIAAYRQLGYGHGKRSAQFDLAVLCDQGHLARHDEQGVRYYTVRGGTR
ncbi:hypothetical protein [Streptomyces sp. NPDC001781]